ncbi:MAG: Hsp20 family protein [Geminicoccaceae bacterium]|nr:Hsp20 family protein [Geminicoccaceae bacterium]
MTVVRFDPFLRPFLLQDRTASTIDYDFLKDGEDGFVLAFAVPGLAEDEIEVQAEGRRLTVKAAPKADPEADPGAEGVYLHRGIRRGGFERAFTLAPHVEVAGATLDKGILRLSLERRVPEAEKPRAIAVNAKAA